MYKVEIMDGVRGKVWYSETDAIGKRIGNYTSHSIYLNICTLKKLTIVFGVMKHYIV